MRDQVLPTLPLDEWDNTRQTLHLYLQVMGKVRMALMPYRNHWWNVTLYVTSTGMSTGPMPFANGLRSLTIELDFIRHQLRVLSSEGEERTTELRDGLSVADFHDELFAHLESLGVEVQIYDRPYDLPVEKRFGEITDWKSYQPEYVNRFWRIMLWVNSVFEEFSGRFYGKTCPVHLYWHHMDLTVTRFSGTRLPAAEGVSGPDAEAYSHEVSSFGFWAGDAMVREPMFYSYTFPSPDGLDAHPLLPTAKAGWVDSNGSPMAMLSYEAVRTSDEPRTALLSFLESAYQGGANLAGWDVASLTTPYPSSR